MRSLSILKVLQYLDIVVRRIKVLYERGDKAEALERIALMRSICTRTLEQLDTMEATIEGASTADQMEAEMTRFLAGLPDTGERDAP